MHLSELLRYGKYKGYKFVIQKPTQYNTCYRLWIYDLAYIIDKPTYDDIWDWLITYVESYEGATKYPGLWTMDFEKYPYKNPEHPSMKEAVNKWVEQTQVLQLKQYNERI